MKLEYFAAVGLLDGNEFVLDADVEWELGTPRLVINDVMDSSGTYSLLFHDDELMVLIARRVVKMAVADDDLISRAVEEDVHDREAA